MGYHGYGLIKELYTRKPKKSFKKMKDRYGEKVEEAPINTSANEKFQTDYSELINYRNKVRSRGKVYKVISNTIFLLGILLFMYLVLNWIGEKI